MAHGDDIRPGDYVRITMGMYAGWYAVVNEKSYGDEFDIQYFVQKDGSMVLNGKKYNHYWVLKEDDYDSQRLVDMVKVNPD